MTRKSTSSSDLSLSFSLLHTLSPFASHSPSHLISRDNRNRLAHAWYTHFPHAKTILIPQSRATRKRTYQHLRRAIIREFSSALARTVYVSRTHLSALAHLSRATTLLNYHTRRIIFRGDARARKKHLHRRAGTAG